MNGRRLLVIVADMELRGYPDDADLSFVAGVLSSLLGRAGDDVRDLTVFDATEGADALRDVEEAIRMARA